MSEKIAQHPPRPDTSHLITEDDRPVDNRFSERQMRMLPHILLTGWHADEPFEALADVGLFFNLKNEDVVAPDFLFSLGVTPRPVTADQENRSYFMWDYGKAPDLVIEIVSNKTGGELTTRLEKYARIRVTYYAVYDPFHCLGKPELRLYHLVDGRYLDMTPSSFMTEIGLGLVVWNGCFEKVEARWLRFVDRDGNLIPTGEEATREANERAMEAVDEANRRADDAAHDKARAIARKALSKGMDIESVAEITSLTLDDIKQIQLSLVVPTSRIRGRMGATEC